MDHIYVTGHRNPDTDSIVAAMAYAALRNACGDREYEAACLGHVSDETQIVLDRFGFQPPTRIHNMYTQVRDLDFDKPPILSAAVTLGRAWQLLSDDKKSSALPVANEDGSGHLTKGPPGIGGQQPGAGTVRGLGAEHRRRPPVQRLLDKLGSVCLLPPEGGKEAAGGNRSAVAGERSNFHVPTNLVCQGDAPDKPG